MGDQAPYRTQDVDFEKLRAALDSHLLETGFTAKKFADEHGLAESTVSQFRTRVTKTLKKRSQLEALIQGIGKQPSDFIKTGTKDVKAPDFLFCRDPDCSSCLWLHSGKVRIYMPTFMPASIVPSGACPNCDLGPMSSACPECQAPLAPFARCPSCGAGYIEVSDELANRVEEAARTQEGRYVKRVARAFELAGIQAARARSVM